MFTNYRHTFFYSGEENRHQYMVGFLLHRDRVCSISSQQADLILPESISFECHYHKFMNQYLDIMTIRWTNSTIDSRKSKAKYQRKTFVLYKFQMFILKRMHIQIG